MKTDGFVAALVTQKYLPLPMICMADINLDQICKTICGYLNDNGGWVVLGMDSDYSCVEVEEGIRERIQEAIVSLISPLPLVYVQEDLFQGHKLILVTVMKGSLPPYTYKGNYYIMQNGQSVVPTMDQMACLLRDSYAIRSGWETDNCLTGGGEMLDEELMSAAYSYGKKSGRIRKEYADMAEVLSELQLITASNVTNGAMALFAKDTSRILPQCRVRIQTMLKGRTASVYEDAPDYYTGNIFQTLQQVLDYFKKRLPLVMAFSGEGSKRKEKYSYPLEVIDEAVTNALIHRDYTNRVDEVTIFIYADRIEISNSGEMPKGMLNSKNSVATHGSVLRNPLMAEVFYISGEMEKTGRGMMLISETMRTFGAKLPEWRSANGKTTLTLYSGTRSDSLSVRATEYLRKHKTGYAFSKTEYAKHWGVSLPTAYLDIKAMLANEKLEVIGNGPQTHYIIK